MDDRRVALAARNNAEWCDLFCRAHGIRGGFTSAVWRAPRRPPPFYPDAVTLSGAAMQADVTAGIDLSPGASVKDSFGTLDLSTLGFTQLFEAQWVWLDPEEGSPSPMGSRRWTILDDPTQLPGWEAAWSGQDQASGSFLPALLEDPRVSILAAWSGSELVTGAVVSRSAAVAGVSNVFDVTGDVETAYAGASAAARALAPDVPLVGYEHGSDLEAARAVGFRPIGPLRVWLR